MVKDQAQTFLTTAFRKNHVSALLRHFSGMVQEFQEAKWEDSIAKSGKFVEAVLKGLFVHVGKTLPGGRSFKADAVINGLGQLAPGSYDDSIRLTIPRACRFVYDIASNRGGRHDPAEVDPNEMDTSVVVLNCSWILAEMIRLATKGTVDLKQAKNLVESLMERKYPLIEEVEGRMYFHLNEKSAPGVALLALARRYPNRIGRQDLIDTVKRNGFKESNARMAVQRITRFVDNDGQGQLRLLATGLREAEQIMKAKS